MMRAGGDVQPVARLHLEDVVADANPEESLDDRVALVLRVRVLLEDRALAVRVHDDLVALPLEKSHDALFRHGTVLLGPGLEARFHAPGLVGSRVARRSFRSSACSSSF